MATGLHTLRPWLRPYATQLVNIAAAAGLAPLVSSARRSHSQQALLYRRYLAGQSRFPAAPPGNSAHELGLAFDLWVNDESQLADLGKVWEGWGGTWGGRFRDPIHFEGPRDSADRPEYVDDPGVHQSRFIDVVNAHLNARAARIGVKAEQLFETESTPVGLVEALASPKGVVQRVEQMYGYTQAAMEPYLQSLFSWLRTP